MNKEEPFRNQAERSKKRIQKNVEMVEVNDSGKLPPREQVHRQKRKKTKWKVKYPVIRLLVLCFILLPIIIFSVISYRENGKKIGGTEKTSGNSVGYETINLDEMNQEDEPKETPQDKGGEVDSEGENDQVPSDTKQGEANESENHPDQSSSQDESSTNNQITGINNNKQGETTTSPTNTNSNTTTNKNVTETTSDIVYHTVQPHETLFRIAIKYYKSQNGIEIIKNANNLQTEAINVGQVLKIPLNK
ncbi:LysM peptidoglycan-binding domain-containing protein [Neobacillus jeddahensis]|uniref:LysM peptidoglycan-binding domain-containing protein n=1 Tax=Neobacillus jeddahensis TaxID=1461580 RepID=UPI0005910BF3|nr:LysM peptidoglycan-binding domain-containing protein [Neobacillus jeddahensis]